MNTPAHVSSSVSPFRIERHPLKVRRLSVKRLCSVTPRMLRITFGGSDLADFVALAPEDHIKIFFPHPDEAEPPVPRLGLRGLVFSQFGRKPHVRDYTPLRFDADALELDVDFYLHGRGVAANWAAQARPGDFVYAVGPRGSRHFEGQHAHHVFLGDATAIPEMRRRLESLPVDVQKTAFFFVDHAQEQQGNVINETCHWMVLGSPQWPTRDEEGLGTVKGLLKELHPSSDTFFWIAGEAAQTRALARFVHLELDVHTNDIYMSGHWKSGTQGHDHHEQIDISR